MMMWSSFQTNELWFSGMVFVYYSTAQCLAGIAGLFFLPKIAVDNGIIAEYTWDYVGEAGCICKASACMAAVEHYDVCVWILRYGSTAVPEKRKPLVRIRKPML